MSYKESYFYRCLKEIVYLCFIHPSELMKENRRKKGKNSDFEKLSQYKKKFDGRRCFIIATGPSLTEFDYLSLRDEVTIGVNGLCLWFKEKHQETSFFVVSDEEVFDRVKDTLSSLKNTIVFISERVAAKREVPKQFFLFPVDIWNRYMTNDSSKRLSNDISVCSYDEETVVFHAIQIALFLGFKEIYLLGTDCNYDQKKVYAVDHGKKVDKSVGPKMIRSYQVVKKYENIYNFQVFNATRGGMLEVFPRVDLDAIINK